MSPSKPPAPRRSLRRKLTSRLIGIAVAVVLFNIGIVALFDASDRGSLLLDLAKREVLRLEAAYRATGGEVAALVADPGPIYIEHPAAYAFALIEADGAVIDGRNLGLIPADMLRPGPFATDWLAWPNGVGVLPVVATHNIAGSAPPVSVVFFMTSDPADLLGAEIWDEFRGHVWLPLLPIAALLIGGTLLTVQRALRPVASAAAWARRLEPGRKVPVLDQADAPAEIFDLTEAVRRSIARLDDELAAEQRRAAEAAHALRTPVAVLVARIDELPADPAFDTVRADVRALSRMVTQFLTSAGADRLEIAEGERADLMTVARRVVTDLVPFADARGSEIEFLPANAAVMVRGSEDAIGLALTNLIENAIIHASGRIEVQVGPGPEIQVRDHGAGLPGAAQDLFEPFRRGKGAARGGAGLGLAIVARIQRAHGGTIAASPAPDQGTIFRLGYRAG